MKTGCKRNANLNTYAPTHLCTYSLVLLLASLLLCFFASPTLAADRDTLMQKARQTSWQGKHEEAEALYRQLVRRNPQDIEAWLGLAQVLSWQKQFQEARAIYNKVRQMRPDLPDGDIGLLRLKGWEGEHQEAQEGLEALLSKHPKRLDILILLGRVTAWQGKFQPSIDYYQTALELYPDNMETLQGLATTYKWMKKAKEGIALYSKILEKDPNNLKAIIDIGILYSHDGKHKEAIAYLETARAMAPDRKDVRAMLGTLYSWTAQLDDAVTEFQKSVALERGNISGYIALGRVYSWQKKTQESIKLYEQALTMDPENTEALVGLGTTYLYNNQWDRAEELYQKALKIRPQDVGARKALERLQKVKAPELTVRYDFFEFRDHDPQTGTLATLFRDHRETLEYFHKLSPKTILHVRSQRSDQKQVDKAGNVTDFNIDTNIGSVGLQQKLPNDFGLRFRYDFAEFTNDGNNDFNLQGRKSDHAGYFILSKEYKRHYWTASFGRELFISTTTGNATVASINTYGASYDVDITDHFSILVVPSLHDYSTPTGFRQDHSLRPRVRLPFYDKVQLEYQFRYLSNPNQYENSVFVNFQHQFNRKFRYEIDYIPTHSSFDDSLEHRGTLFFTWDIAKWISWGVDARFAIEHLKDKDITQNYQTYFTSRF